MTKPQLLALLTTAVCPEDVFGISPKDLYREFSRLLHPDLNPSDRAAEDGFKRLNEFKDQADEKIKKGVYGDRAHMAAPVVIKTKKSVYTVRSVLARGDLCQVYSATNDKDARVVLKVPRSPANNDLLVNEATRIHFIRNESASKALPVLKHLPVLLDSFTMEQNKIRKQVNVMAPLDGFYSLRQVLQVYPKGLELSDAAWMFNRLLGALLAAHNAGLVHGAVTLDHMLIHPASHNGVLIDWSYSVKQGEVIKAICPAYKTFYPLEVLSKAPADAGVDLYMAAKLMMVLLTGDLTGNASMILPKKVMGLLRACWLGPKQRSKDVFELFEDFKQVLQDIYGKPKFREFHMPVRSAV